MRIDDLNRTPVTPAAEKSDPAGGKRTEAGSTAVNGADQADVSQLAQALAPGDPQRIEQLRLQVQSGNYDVPADVVANAIIDAHLSE